MRPERHPLAQIVVAPHQLPKEPSLLPRANLLQPDLAQIPRRAHQSGARLSPCRHRYLGRFPPRPPRPLGGQHQPPLALQLLQKLPALPRFERPPAALPPQQLAHGGGQFHPAQTPTRPHDLPDQGLLRFAHLLT